MLRRLPGWYWTILLSLFSLALGLLAPAFLSDMTPQQQIIGTPIAQQASATATETIPPVTPLSTATERPTLLPPPTLEPPTATAPPSATPTPTATQPILIDVTVSGLRGLPSATPTGTIETCTVREDWTLRYEIQTNETLTQIANRFNTDVFSLQAGNCLEDANLIRAGQQLRVPGDSIPQEPEFVCEPITLLQPLDDAWDIPATGTLTFNWRGPRTPHYLIRLYPPDFDFVKNDPDEWIERTFDLRQNETFNLADLPDGGKWSWHVVPLDGDFVQVCPESALWRFNKEELERN